MEELIIGSHVGYKKDIVKYQKNKIDNKDKWCQLIADIGFDYDGCNTIESLKGLIDELVRYALNSRDNYDYKEILMQRQIIKENAYNPFIGAELSKEERDKVANNDYIIINCHNKEEW